MRVGDSWRKFASSDLAVLVLLATAGVLLHTITNGQYGFHHDELATLDDARSLAWGYVAYPPLSPFLARIAFILFGPSLIGLRFFAAVALGLVLVLTGLMARRLGGGRQAQIVAALAAAIGGVAFSAISTSDEPIHLCSTSSGSRRTLPLSHCGWPAYSICSPPRRASGTARLGGCSLSPSRCS
jgi:4-amino-4-deoxy-L-arabinose transferase-like glycosyltransferase